MKKLSLFLLLFLIGITSCEKSESKLGEISDPNLPSPRAVSTKTVRFVYFIPSGASYNQAAFDAIREAALTVQAWYAEHLNGRLLRYNNPIVEVMYGERTTSWYETTVNEGNPAYYTLENTWDEVARRLGIGDFNPDYKTVIYTSAAGSGAANYNGTVLPKADLEGIMGIGNGDGLGIRRWWLGLAHELGHTFGLPDTQDANSIMGSGGFFKWPNSTLTTSETNSMLNSGFLNSTGSFPFNSTVNYKITNFGSGLQAAVEGASTNFGAKIVQWSANTGTNQRFKMSRVGKNRYRIVGQQSGNAWDVTGGSTADNANIIQWDNSESENRTFNLVKHRGRWMIFSANSLKAVAPLNESNALGTNLIQTTSRIRNSQMWTIN